MLEAEIRTREKIVIAALALFSERGISKASVNEVAYRAGVSRVTVYRYFSGKKELVRAAYLRIEQVFQKGLFNLQRNPDADWKNVLKQIGEDLSSLPSGDVFARFDELKRLYPDVYESIQQVRAAVLSGIFEYVFVAAEREGLLRPGLDRSFVQAVYWELLVNIFDNPRFKSFGLSDAQLYNAITDILLYGIFLGRPTGNSVEVYSQK